MDKPTFQVVLSNGQPKGVITLPNGQGEADFVSKAETDHILEILRRAKHITAADVATLTDVINLSKLPAVGTHIQDHVELIEEYDSHEDRHRWMHRTECVN